jgi:Lrp/AsnC family transcriptional regulator, leucine-responsive regulatory protein
MISIDEIDLSLLALLQQDARLSKATLGEKVGLTGPAVYARLQRLEQEGIIRQYTVLLEPSAIGQGLVAFMRVQTNSVALKDEDAFIAYVLKESRVLECHDVDGEDSYILKVRTNALEDLRILVNEIRALPNVSRTVTSIAMVTVKEGAPTYSLAKKSAAKKKGQGK